MYVLIYIMHDIYLCQSCSDIFHNIFSSITDTLTVCHHFTKTCLFSLICYWSRPISLIKWYLCHLCNIEWEKYNQSFKFTLRRHASTHSSTQLIKKTLWHMFTKLSEITVRNSQVKVNKFKSFLKEALLWDFQEYLPPSLLISCWYKFIFV